MLLGNNASTHAFLGVNHVFKRTLIVELRLWLIGSLGDRQYCPGYTPAVPPLILLVSTNSLELSLICWIIDEMHRPCAPVEQPRLLVR